MAEAHEYFRPEDIDRLYDATKAEVTQNSRNTTDMKKALQEMLAHKDDTPEAEDVLEDTTLSNEESQGEDAIIFKFRKYLTTLKENEEWASLNGRRICCKCGDTADEPWVTECLHLYCHECLKALQFEASENDEDSATCIECQKCFNGARPCNGLKELESNDIIPAAQKGSVTENKGRPHRTANDNMKWCDLGGQTLPSTKTAAVQVQVEQWLKRFPQIKIIVFSQFHLS